MHLINILWKTAIHIPILSMSRNILWMNKPESIENKMKKIIQIPHSSKQFIIKCKVFHFSFMLQIFVYLTQLWSHIYFYSDFFLFNMRACLFHINMNTTTLFYRNSQYFIQKILIVKSLINLVNSEDWYLSLSLFLFLLLPW